MKITRKEIITIVVFTTLLVSWAPIQMGLKPIPQIVLMLFGLITFGLSYLNTKIVFRIPFYLILGVVLFLAVFGLIIMIMDVFLPHRGMVEVDGELYGTNGDPFIIEELFFTTLITLALLLLNLSTWKSNIKLEKYFILAFTLLTSVVWFLYEL